MTDENILDLNIYERTMGYARIYASLIKDEFQRKRAYASMVGLFALVEALEKTDNDIQKNMTLFRHPKLNEKYELADFYINNWHIDVRIIGEGYNVLIPKCHFDNDIIPDYYAVIKLDKEITNAKLIGFLDTEKLEKKPNDYHYYSVPIDSLISYEEFLIKIHTPKQISFDASEHEKFRSLYLSILDQEVNVQTETSVLKHLFECQECRTEFCCFTGFEMVNSNLGRYPDLFEDKTLSIIGAQIVYDDKYEGKEEVIDISNNDEASEPEKAPESENSTPEETNPEPEETNPESAQENADDQSTSDILDELFSEEEDQPVEVKTAKKDPDNIPDIKENETLQTEEIQVNTEINHDVDIENPPELELDDNENVELPNIDNDLSDEDKSSNVKIINDEPPITSMQEETVNNSTDVQKVIVDYDEHGEPIYSYITNVPPEDEKQDNFDSELSDDDILNEEFETYNPQVSNDDLSFIKNGGQRTVEYIQNEDVSDEIVDIPQSENQIIEEPNEIKNEDEGYVNYSANNNQDLVYTDLQDSQSEEQDLVVQSNNNDNNGIEFISNDENSETDEFEEPEDFENDKEYEEYEAEDEEQEGEEEINQEEDNNEDFLEYKDDDQENEDSEQDYEEEDDDVDDEISNYAGTSAKKGSKLFPILIGIILIGSVIGGLLFFKNSKSNEETQQIAQNNGNVQYEQPQNIDEQQNQDDFQPQEDYDNSANTENNENELPMLPSSGSIDIPQLTENNLTKPQNPNTADVNTAMTNAFSNRGTSLSLRNLNWLCTPQLFTDNQFKSYLQNLDNLLKLNLRKNILNATDNPQNNNISVKMAIDNDGNLIKTLISDSSGSEQIDNIVLQSINETFDGEKSPILTNSPLKADKYYLKVIIKL